MCVSEVLFNVNQSPQKYSTLELPEKSLAVDGLLARQYLASWGRSLDTDWTTKLDWAVNFDLTAANSACNDKSTDSSSAEQIAHYMQDQVCVAIVMCSDRQGRWNLNKKSRTNYEYNMRQSKFDCRFSVTERYSKERTAFIIFIEKIKKVKKF